MPILSNARQFFDDVSRSENPVTTIRSLVDVAQPVFESDWLDFKTEPHKTSDRARKYREQLLEALSGFSNNQGGVVVWGIVAKKHDRDGVEVDAAMELKPIDSPDSVKSRLIELCRGATDPPVANIEILAYPDPATPGKGFVLCHVPEGRHKPYRTINGEKSQFYFRAGDSTIVMPTRMIQHLFYPRSSARFALQVACQWQLRFQDHQNEFRIRISIENVGTAPARNTAVWWRQYPALTSPPSINPGTGWGRIESSVRFSEPLLPKMPAVFATQLVWSGPTATWRNKTSSTFDGAPLLDVGCTADSQETQYFRILSPGFPLQPSELMQVASMTVEEIDEHQVIWAQS